MGVSVDGGTPNGWFTMEHPFLKWHITTLLNYNSLGWFKGRFTGNPYGKS
jgi:hypothetical protein